jgi:vancomycin resistance protein YoaR
MRGIFNSRMTTAVAVLTRMKPLSLYHPALYWLHVWQKRLFRRLAWHFFPKPLDLTVQCPLTSPTAIN